jgi:glycosyltransferase involved in cell wall biosynthesis
MQPLEPHSPAVSVIVPTFNRRESLLRLLASLDRQTLSIERFEVVVVDNNSSDETAAEVASFARSSRARIRCLTERVQGAAYARNRGIRESTAPVVASTDDDVEADPQWLEQAMRGLETSSAAVVGGRTVPVWDGSLPEWWLPQYEKVFFKDLGADARPVVPPDYFYTHNLVVRREPLLRVGLFDTRLAPTGRRHLVGEDVELCRRIHEDGNALYYFPPAIVRHHVEADRLSRPFLRRRYFTAACRTPCRARSEVSVPICSIT